MTEPGGAIGIGSAELIVLLVVFGFFSSIFICAFVDILRSEFTRNNKLVWLLLVIFVLLIGPIAYFIIGKKQKIVKKG